jgi:chromosome segregation ATPase
MPAELGPLLDVILLGVLGVVMYRSWQLSRQFDKIQQDRAAFEQLIQALNIATARAEGAVHGLKNAVTEAGDQLQTKVNAARALSDELEIMVQAGDSLAERLQTLAEKSHKSTAAAPANPPPEPRADVKPATTPRTKAEKELLEAMKAKQQS